MVYFRFPFVNRNKEKEESRQGKLTEFKETGKWPGMKSKPVENVAWSKKLEKKDRKEKRKRIKEMKELFTKWSTINPSILGRIGHESHFRKQPIYS